MVAPLLQEIWDTTDWPFSHTTFTIFNTEDKLVSSRLNIRSDMNWYFYIASVYAEMRMLALTQWNTAALAMDIPSGVFKVSSGWWAMNVQYQSRIDICSSSQADGMALLPQATV